MQNHITEEAKNKKAQVLKCSKCSQLFIFRPNHSFIVSDLCAECRKTLRQEELAVQKAKENERVWEARKKDHELFLRQLKELNGFNLMDVESVKPLDGKTLYILGNGFDLMHGVKSSYYSFRDSLGKGNSLRFALESLLTGDDFWSDFENSLAYFNINALADKKLVDMWLDIFDAYSQESAADFYLAVEACANLITTICNELPRRFRMWVNSLKIRTDERPLSGIFSKDVRVLCFNYTEFVESLYGIDSENVCYIHGCRRKQKGAPKEKLILGHQLGVSKESFEKFHSWAKEKDYKSTMISLAQERIMDLISQADKELTKNCDDIINSKQSFFASLKNIKRIITIGHSFSEVDWPYFTEVTKHVDLNAVEWYFGCYGLNDFNNLQNMINKLRLESGKIHIFRTDTISVHINSCDEAVRKSTNEWKTLAYSQDKKYSVKGLQNHFSVFYETSEIFNLLFDSPVASSFFSSDARYLFVITKGWKAGVFLFYVHNQKCELINELEPAQNQNLINVRLKKVFLTDRTVQFIYNNRIREYDLSSGNLIASIQKRNAALNGYSGSDITERFVGTKKYRVSYPSRVPVSR